MINGAIGIAGTAKNTGKTTTTLALMEFLHSRDIRLGVTSIGYDGERLDTITGLPKPRIFLKKGDFVALSENCLPVSSAKFKVHEKLDIATPLGQVVCAEVVKEGLVVVAGPNQSAHLKIVRQWMERHHGGVLIVDGALNRIAPMVETDGLILCTGSAYTTDIHRLTLETRSIEVICNQPDRVAIPEAGTLTNQSIFGRWNGDVLASLPPFLFNTQMVTDNRDNFTKSDFFYCPGVVSKQCLITLSEMPLHREFTLVFEDPIKILLSGDAISASHCIEKLLLRGGRLGYRKLLPLLAVTVNPFYPRHRCKKQDYQPAYMDWKKLLSNMRKAVDIPVCDVLQEGIEELIDAMNNIKRSKISEF